MEHVVLKCTWMYLTYIYQYISYITLYYTHINICITVYIYIWYDQYDFNKNPSLPSKPRHQRWGSALGQLRNLPRLVRQEFHQLPAKGQRQKGSEKKWVLPSWHEKKTLDFLFFFNVGRINHVKMMQKCAKCVCFFFGNVGRMVLKNENPPVFFPEVKIPALLRPLAHRFLRWVLCTFPRVEVQVEIHGTLGMFQRLALAKNLFFGGAAISGLWKWNLYQKKHPPFHFATCGSSSPPSLSAIRHLWALWQ